MSEIELLIGLATSMIINICLIALNSYLYFAILSKKVNKQ